MRKTLCILAVCALLGLALAGCNGKQSASNGDTLKGDIAISGAWALYPMVVTWSEEFQKVYPDVQFDISAGGAGKGMADALGGAVDIGMVSRNIQPVEVEQGAFRVQVTRDAVLPTISANNPYLARLQAGGATQTVMKGIWRGEITTWGEVLGDPSITDEIHVYTRSDACGAAETWAGYLGDFKQEDLQGVAVYGDPGLASAVTQDPLGIGYNNLNFAYDADSGKPVEGLQILPLDRNDNATIDDAEDFYAVKTDVMAAIADGRYPSPPARTLNLVTKGKPTGITLAFVQWVLTDGQAFVESTGYIPLTDAELEAELANLK
jgi:phosphate transport system substrate-binding protein